MQRTLLLALSFTFICVSVSPQEPKLAPTPPMGWNSWDSYGLSVTEQEFQANAQWMAQHLKRYGWQYAVVDEGWYLKNPSAKAGEFQFTMDENGRYVPAVNRFSSAASGAGFKPLADAIHQEGLKFGIHIIRGIPREAVDKGLKIAGSEFSAADAADRSDTCQWNADNYGVKASPAGQAYYDSVAKLYAQWGIDFVKIDCISSPYKADEIHMFSRALEKSGRPIVLSLSPGPTPLDQADDVRKWAQMWRISGDVWDHWPQLEKQEWTQGLLAQFKLASQWAPHVEPGHWPDADMLPLGHLGPRPGFGKGRDSAFTHDEERTLMTLWSIVRSPLVMGGNLTQMDDYTTALLTNPEVLAVDQHSKGGHPVIEQDKATAWLADTEKGRGHYLALFNLSDEAQTLEYNWKDLGLSDGAHRIRDLWERKDLGKQATAKVQLAPHASALWSIN